MLWYGGKIGDFASYGSDPRRIRSAGSETDGLSVNYKQKYSAQQQVIKDNYAIFEVPYRLDRSESYIINLDGEVVQHIEYVPFGEVFIEERSSIWNTPYLFNAKEFDEETGLYYYGARYYDSRLSLWISTDPMQERYPSVSSYTYCINNPSVAKDGEGKKPIYRQIDDE